MANVKRRNRSISRSRLIKALRPHLGELPIRNRFQLLHDLGVYHGEVSLSGHASDPAETAHIKAWLPDLIERLDVKSILDAPCGDCHWMASANFFGVAYTGIDIVPDLIEKNRERYGASGRFLQLDLTHDPLPSADLVLCRDLLIHLSSADGLSVLANLCRTNSRWLLTTSFVDRTANLGLPSGDFHPVNLALAPFCLPHPIETFNEQSKLGRGRFADRSLCLWSIDEVRKRLAEADADLEAGDTNGLGPTAQTRSESPME